MFERSQVELLAPAGDEECFKAAIAAGADAIYFGMEQFSARTRAKNITVDQAKYLIPLAHKKNCRTYLTLNTLISDDEMPAAVSLVEKAVDCGIDAVIVQDLGVLKVLRTCFPDLELHASTQMTTHNLSQCEFLSELGVSQINLSRELSLQEIQNLTTLLHSKNIVPEIFVQGAFCISYSGQCYLSGHLYGEAGNRGSCVQPCRRCWGMKDENTKDYKALFHLKDNSAFPLADELIRQNVPVSLKIEGRIKNAEYVWAVTSAWREQIDLILAEKPILKSSPKLTGAINRDYTCGYLEGNINSNMFSSGAKDISQLKVGLVKNYIADSKTLILNDDVKLQLLNKGDRLTIKTANDQFICTAKVVDKTSKGYTIQITNKLTKKILGGQVIYKSSSVISPEELSKILDNLTTFIPKNDNCASAEKLYKVDIFVTAVENEKLEITFTCENQLVTVMSEQPLVKAQNAGLTEETLREKLTKLGGTCFELNKFTIEELAPGLFISLSELNNLRRKAVEQLEKKIADSIAQNDAPTTNATKTQLPCGTKTSVTNAREAFLIDTPKALNQLLLEKSDNKKDFKIIYELPSCLDILENEFFNTLNENPQVVLYFNSILMDEELQQTASFIKKLNNLQQREILCENTGLAYLLKNTGCKIILGPNCNIYNSWNIQEYNENLNLTGVVPSLELASEQIEKLHFPENLQLWYPKTLHTLLMQSRQCLVRNGSSCKKACVDQQCIKNCSKKLELSGTQGEKILAVKRPGFYSALYTSQAVKYECTKDFAKKVSVWIIDKRATM